MTNVTTLKPKMKLVASIEPFTRPVLSVFYIGKKVARNNRSGNPLRAATKAGEYMRTNKYEATHCEVYNEVNGDLYAVIKRDVNGNVHTLFERKYDPKKGY